MFEFDPAKSAANKAKHGIDFEEAQALWLDEDRLTIPSIQSLHEERWLVVGEMFEKVWTAIVTYRDTALRIISVRRARDEEIEAYGRKRKAD